MISEEFVTRKLLSYLNQNKWNILCFDFPQSGTGFSLRPNSSTAKNKDVIIPDIVAVKDNQGILFENKDRFFLSDFNKIEKLRTTEDYLDSLERLMEGNMPEEMYYGIAYPHFENQLKKADPFLNKIDFLLAVTSDGDIVEYHNPHKIKFF